MLRLAAAALLLLTAPALAQSPPLAYVQPLAPPALRAVQDRLHAMGAYNGAVDGVWGQDSQAALQQFQQSHQLQMTGQMNAATAEVLGLDPTQLLQMTPATQPPPSAEAPARPPPPPIRLGPDAIRNIQGRLGQLGFYSGAVDGMWGPGTEGAIARLQQAHNLPATGRLDPPTVSAMGLDPNNPGAPMR